MWERARLSWALRRNRLIGGAAANGLARWFPGPGRRYARRLFDLTAGFVYAQVIQALVTSGLLARLAQGPAALDEAVLVAGLDGSATLTLLRAAKSLQLVEERGGTWLLAGLGAALAAMPGLADMVRHHRLLYADLADPLAMLRGGGAGELARLWRYDGTADPADVATYSALMAATQPMVAQQVLGACSFAGSRALLDVGGGTGGFLAAVRTAYLQLRLGLFDRPAVVEGARGRVDAALHPGSFRDDPLPGGYDAISLVRVLHDHDDEVVHRLLASVRAALPAGGRLVIAEPLADTPGAESMGHAYFGFYLAAMRSGRPRTYAEYAAMLRAAGFASIRRKRTSIPLITSVIIAVA